MSLVSLVSPIRNIAAVVLFAASTVFSSPAWACAGEVSACSQSSPHAFGIIREGNPATVFVDTGADDAVLRVARSLAADIERMSGRKPEITSDLSSLRGEVVIVGQVGMSPALELLASSGKLDLSELVGQWEGFRQEVVEQPLPGVSRALVIAGSDRRGAVFGAYDLSERMGVSPWHWWADVPVERKSDLYFTTGSRSDAPKVRYRGFFINDEDPALSGWAVKKFGGVNSAMYEHVFELLLRLKGNYLWPAMWGKSFNVDDPQSKVLADAMGVVMGTSHHEPLTRAQAEWNSGEMGKWDYTANPERLRAFWRGGVERMMTACGDGPCDSLLTIGMRGDGDEPMTEGTAIELLETIVADQRSIISDVTGKPASETPQVWALYKEVQDYYDHGMRVPDDVILLFADDNWGQIRRLPAIDAAPRSGGYGVYYHFDYVGGPRSYKWLNTNQVEKTWQQMDLAWQSGARALWIVNVGDIKPMEYPIDFFMQQAWNPEAMTPEVLAAYPREFAEQSFGGEHAEAIAHLLTEYGKLAARRKPELVDAGSFPPAEFQEILLEWAALERLSDQVGAQLAEYQKPAFFQLVQHPIEAVSNLYRMYYAAAMNRELAAEGDQRANAFADEVEQAFAQDRRITDAYHAVNGGKWDGMINQTHIGYTSWDDPDADVMPDVVRVDASARRDAPYAPSIAADGWSFSIEAPDYSRALGGKGLEWVNIPDLGRTKGAVVTLPQGQASTRASDNIRLEYDLELPAGEVPVRLVLAPALDTQARGGIRIGVSLDDGPVAVLSSTLQATGVAPVNQNEVDWEEAVRNNAHVLSTSFPAVAKGRHVLKIWRIDDNAVLQRIAVGPGTGRYLGPPLKE